MDFLSKAKQVLTARLETGSATAASLRLSADGNSHESDDDKSLDSPRMTLAELRKYCNAVEQRLSRKMEGGLDAAQANKEVLQELRREEATRYADDKNATSNDDDSLDTPRMTDAEFWTRFTDFEERVSLKIEGGLGNTQAQKEVLLEMRLADEERELYEYLHLDLDALDKVSESIITELREEKKLTATAANANHSGASSGRATIDVPQDPAEVSSERSKILGEQKRQGALLETMRQEQEARHVAIRDEMKFLRSEVTRLNLIVARYEARDAERAALKEG